jgi:hypothetical protein
VVSIPVPIPSSFRKYEELVKILTLQQKVVVAFAFSEVDKEIVDEDEDEDAEEQAEDGDQALPEARLFQRLKLGKKGEM